jgi:hypothetical protein
LRSLYRRSQTLYEHQRWAAEQWGLGKFTEDVEKLTDTAFRKEVSVILLPNHAAAPPSRAAERPR